MIYIIYFICFGFLISALIGLLTSWIDRKVTARVQYRVGPPLLQPLIDIIKLLGKETLIPRGASKPVFLMAEIYEVFPVVGGGQAVSLNSRYNQLQGIFHYHLS